MLLLPLYASVVAIGMLGVWLGSVAYYVSLGITGTLGVLWALSVLPLMWLLAMLVVFEWSLVGAAALLLAGSGAHPRRDSSPLSRLILSVAQRSLFALRAMRELLHPGAILQLPALRPKFERGADPGAPAAPEEAGAGAAEDDDETDGFLAAGRRCARLFATTPARLHAARAHTHYVLEHAKISVAAGSGLVGWFWLTDPPAAPLLTPLWPLLLIVLGSYALASTAITLSQASVEAVLQCFCEETRLLVRNGTGGKPQAEADKPTA